MLGITYLVAAQADLAAEEAPYAPPATLEGAHFFEPFLSHYGAFTASKDEVFSGEWKHELYTHDALAGDMGLVVGSVHKKHAVSSLFAKPFVPKDAGGLVIQYELQLKNKLSCGGAYLKLLTASEALDHDGFNAETPYTIMFGPDKCGGTNKVHFILRHQNPVSKEWEEKHLQSPPTPEVNDGLTHLYTAIVGSDNTVKLLVDNKQVKSASLLSASDFKPPINPEKVVDDPDDKKPAEWVDEPKIDDPEASKPDDWDEDAPAKIADPKAEKPPLWLDDAPLKVPDPSATPPGDWDMDEDGEWEAPLVDNPDCKGEGKGCGEWKAPIISNPAYKGKWHAPRVDNPAYVGVWKPRQIDNPSYFSDEAPWQVAPVGGIGIELLTDRSGILFDNIVLAGSADVAAGIAASAFEARAKGEQAAKRKDKSKGDGVRGMIADYAARALEFVQENLLIVGATLCIGVLPLLLFCCGGSKKKAPAAAAAAAAAASAAAASSSSEPGPSSAGEADVPADDEDEKPEEEPVSKKAGKKPARTKKAD